MSGNTSPPTTQTEDLPPGGTFDLNNMSPTTTIVPLGDTGTIEFDGMGLDIGVSEEGPSIIVLPDGSTEIDVEYHSATFDGVLYSVFLPPGYDLTGGYTNPPDSPSTTVYDEFLTFTVECFMAGTSIEIGSGELPVERLSVGDMVRTHSHGQARVEWIGRRRVDCRRHPKPRQVWPVRVKAGAFEDARPRRDLWLSPDHAVFVDDVLIPIKRLINGTSIAQVPVEELTYYHVALERHDVILAEGLPTESYLDRGDRSNFDRNSGAIRLFPDFSAPAPDVSALWEAHGCAELIVTGTTVDAVRLRLKKRAVLCSSSEHAMPQAPSSIGSQTDRPRNQRQDYAPSGAGEAKGFPRSTV